MTTTSLPLSNVLIKTAVLLTYRLSKGRTLDDCVTSSMAEDGSGQPNNIWSFSMHLANPKGVGDGSVVGVKHPRLV